MAAPSITWYKHTSATHAGSSITELSLGSSIAGDYSVVKVITCQPAVNNINNAKFWLSDSLAVLSGGGNVSLGNSTRKWWFKASALDSVSAGIFSKTGLSIGSSLACDYDAVLNSAGAGISIGRGATTNSVTMGQKSKYIVISAQPSSLAYDGTYTDFAFQVSYDFV